MKKRAAEHHFGLGAESGATPFGPASIHPKGLGKGKMPKLPKKGSMKFDDQKVDTSQVIDLRPRRKGEPPRRVPD